MSDALWFTNLDDVAQHLGATVSDARLLWTRTAGAPPVELHWDAARSLVRVRAPMAIDLDGIGRNELALAIAQINFGLGMLALELDAELAFTTHVFLDEDARISSTALAAIDAAIDRCKQRSAQVLAAVRGATR